MSGHAPLIRVVDDDASVRSALTRLLRIAGLQARAYASADEFLLTDDTQAPGCVVLDVGLPGMNGLELYEAIRQKRELSVIFLTGRGDVAMGVSAMKAGAVDFLTKPVKRQALLDAVVRALLQDEERRARQQALASLRMRFAALSERERKVFALVAGGKLNKQIADQLGTSLRTVKTDRARVMRKMLAASPGDLVRAAEQLDVPAA